MSAVGSKRASAAKERSVFVGNIPYDVTEEMLREIFSEAGAVMNFRLVTDRDSGKPKGYGFCEYADGATALSAMRNLNGYEINGRNLRVDFADGGERSSNPAQAVEKTAAGSNGEMMIQAIENAVAQYGTLKTYEMLISLKEHARQRPEMTKNILNSNPILTHAIVQCFKSLNIPILASGEASSGLLLAPPPLAPQFGASAPRNPGGIVRPAHPETVSSGGILGMAPPPSTGAQVEDGPIPQRNQVPSKSSRWSTRSNPPQGSALAGTAPTSNVPSHSRGNRDPRRSKDPRKRGMDDERAEDGHKRPRFTEKSHASHGNDYDAVAQLAREMTPEKMDSLPPNERQLIFSYMRQHNIPFE
uniref:Uncharacterized protein AlNc14C221G9111 n=1 Tax=Albugo laibachii Nc14 TaxID=890382 RepID=F0WRW9_9STRA|nr:conserved hypothetical protein [Albugo laibachii Nc14]|eukprot:CCA24085.1 conserved hypothetical protein [Albugo laibachii Nc14]